jgi:dihydroxy-acid dehydratase
MKYVLPSRELIADSVEAMILGHGIFDGMVMLASCDKIVPGMLMAAGRLDMPTVMVTGGPMQNKVLPKKSKEARQAFLRGEIGEKELVDVTLEYYPTPGVCPFLGTANTMCIVAETLGLSLPGAAAPLALSPQRREIARESGRAVLELVQKGVGARSILTQEAFENTMAVVSSMGGSLNTFLHLPAIAAECGLEVTFGDYDRISRQTPLLTKLVPNSQEYTMADLEPVGGIPAIMKELEPLLRGNALAVNGKTLTENLAEAPHADGTVIRPRTNPFSPEGGVAVLQGNLAPEGAVVKSSAVTPEEWQFRGPAKVYESEEECMEHFEQGKIVPGDVVIVRNEGPKGGPGMREMHRVTEVLAKVGHTALITDGRYSGASGGLAIGYLSPEAADDGAIAYVQNGDMISIDIAQRSLLWEVSPEEEAQRRQEKKPREIEEESLLLKLYGVHASSASRGAVRKA